MTSEKAQEYISKKIKILRHEGHPQRQSVAIAHELARQRGFHVPKNPRGVSKMERSK